MGSKVLTVSVAAYNSADFLHKCIDSLVSIQEKDALEIIIVNDGSKDNTLDIANGYQERFPNMVRVIDKENGGHGSTINNSLAVATGKYFKLVDSDDWVETEGLDQLIHVLRNCTADLVINPYYVVNVQTKEKEKLNPFKKVDYFEQGEHLLEEIPKEYDITLYSTTFRTEVIRNADRSIDEHCFYVDQEFIIYPMAYVKTFLYMSEPIYNYLIGTEGQSCNKKNWIRRRDEHLRVCNSLILCYMENQYNSAQEEIVFKRLVSACQVQYHLYYGAASKVGREELKCFERELKEKSEQLYSRIFHSLPKLDQRILKLLHGTNYGLYGFVCLARKIKVGLDSVI